VGSPDRFPRFEISELPHREEHCFMRIQTRTSLAFRTLLVAGLLAMPSAALWAQTDSPPPDGPPRGQMRGPNPERQLEMLTHVLSLTAEQQTQVKALLTEQSSKMQQLRKTGDASDATNQGGPPNREQMDAVRNDTDAKITALLNDDQKTKFAAWQQQRKERMEHRGDGPPPPPQ